MSQTEKLLAKVLGGQHDTNISFAEVCTLLTKIGFEMRQAGSHRIFRRTDFDMLNLQPAGSRAKPYQIRQVRTALKKGGL